MQTIGSYQVKTHLSKLLEQVEQGEVIVITRRGVPVAKLVPADMPSKIDVRKAIEEIQQLSQGCRLNGLSIKEMRHEGHRC